MRQLITAAALLALAGTAAAYDPLYYDNLTEVLPAMGADGDIALGYFSASQYWETDTLGNSQLYDYEPSLGVVRFLAAGRYGLTGNHTVSVLLPGYLQTSGPNDSTGIGIADPWLTLDGWITRTPTLILRGGLRLPLKGALESGGYREGDPHLALDGAATLSHPLGAEGGPRIDATAGLRMSFWAWDALPSMPKDSAETRPPVQLRLSGFLVYPANPELDVRIGAEIATRGDVDMRSGGTTETLENTSTSTYDLRGGFRLANSGMDLTVDVYYRFDGENADKEWGLMVSGTGLDLGDLFGTTGTTGGSGR